MVAGVVLCHRKRGLWFGTVSIEGVARLHSDRSQCVAWERAQDYVSRLGKRKENWPEVLMKHRRALWAFVLTRRFLRERCGPGSAYASAACWHY